MEFLHYLDLGFSVALTFDNLLLCFIGCVIGTLVGVLPGLGPTATIALLLPITFSLTPSGSMIMLAGIYYGSQYGGSTTAILLNLPGETSSAVTALDGYQMTRNGRSGAALAAAAIGSVVAGTIGTAVVFALSVPLIKLALSFGSPEYFALIVLGLVCSIALASGSVVSSLAMICLGLLLGLVGTDIYTGMPRLTFGSIELFDGINIVAVAVGLFGIAEILRNLESSDARGMIEKKVTGLMPTREDMRRMVGPILRGTTLGSLLGVLPGGGAILASFAAYAAEKKLSRHPEQFGKGAIEGVAAPESANNAGAQTSFIPMLTLGIPANPVMAMMIGALIIHGIVPGPKIAEAQPDLFWGLITSMWIGNLMLIILNLPLIGIWVRLAMIPYSVLFPAIILFASVGVFTVGFNTLDLWVMAGFGLLGYFLSKHDCEPVPLLLGFVLGPLLEEHLRRSLLLSHGDPSIFVTRPISAGLLACAVVLIAIALLPSIRNRRKEVFIEEG